MSVTITPLPDGNGDQWNEYVDLAEYTSPFHRYEALDLVAGEIGATLHHLVGYTGEEPIAILPVFERKRGPFRFVISPPEMEMFSLGPALLNFENLKQRKAERRHKQFVEASLEWIDGLDPDYIDIRTVDRYFDVRPFIWEGLNVSPAYTYVLDLDRDIEELLMSFSRDARTNIRDSEEAAVTVEEGSVETIDSIIDGIAERLNHQGVRYPLDADFVKRLYEALPDDTIRIYTTQLDGEQISGMITLEHNDTIYRWQGGAKVGADPGINDFLDWSIICRAKERGFSRYDLVGANNPRLSRYKSKFNPAPSPYFIAKNRSRRLWLTTGIYHLVPRRFRRL